MELEQSKASKVNSNSNPRFSQSLEIWGNDSHFYIPDGSITLPIDLNLFFNYKAESFKVLAVIGDELSDDLSALVSSNEMSKVASIHLTQDCPILRICDAREAHFIPKSCSKEQMQLALRKARYSGELEIGQELTSWDIGEPYYDMPPSFRIEFWTGNDPAPLLAALEAKGLTGFTKMPCSHYTSVVYTDHTLFQQHYRLFAEVKQELSFRCGFDAKCDHLVYDACQEALTSSSVDAAVYRTNHATAAVVYASNDVYAVEALPSLKTTRALMVRGVTEEDETWL
eukprot:gene34646-41958_t